MLSFFPRGVLDEILNLIESVSEGFAQSVGHLTRKSGVLCSIPGLATYFLLLLCSHSPNDVPREPQRNVSIAAVRGAVRPSKNILSFLLPLFQEGQLSGTGESMCTKYWLTA